MEHFLPWYHFTTVMEPFLPWYHFTTVMEHFLPWYHFTTGRDVTFSTLQGFWYFARSRSREIQVNPRNPAKFTKTRKIPRNSVEILSNTCLYNIFETYFSYWGYLLAVNLQIHLETLSLKSANNVPKLPGVLCCEKLGTSRDVKGLPLVNFLSVLLLKEQTITSVNTGLISAKPIDFLRNLPWK